MEIFLNDKMWVEKDGIMFALGNEVETAFSEEQQNRLFSIEDKSWWFGYRAKVILMLLNKYFSKT